VPTVIASPTTRPTPGWPTVYPPGRQIMATGAATGAGLALGVLTAYAQGWLGGDLNQLANSAGPWSLAAFGLAALVGGPWSAAVSGTLVLVMLELGYVLGAHLQGHGSARSTVTVWLVTAIAVGPALGLGGHCARFGPRVSAALGTAGLSGILIGEAIYGFIQLTYPVWETAELVTGVLLLVVLGSRRFTDWRSLLLALAGAAVVAALFVPVFSNL
jgi:hypothetical protein